ncbi:MAG: CDP-6-deoxy-delta-3,4-glucoseen reductase [Burkholderiales bacterium]
MTFKVSVLPAERSFEVARDEAILPAAIRQGVGLPYGCKDGACSSCKCRLLEGRVIHGAHQLKALSLAEEAAGWVLTCCATPQTDLVLEARQVIAEDQFAVVKMPVRLAALSKPAPDVALLKLQLPASHTFRWHAGQYLEFILKDGVRRAYSIANAPHTVAGGLELHIRHMPGGVFTDHVFGAMKEKEILRAEGPFGTFFLRDSNRPLVLLASGTGFAPVKAMLEDLLARGTDRPVSLYWGCRSKADLYLHDWALAMAQQMPGLRYVPVLSEPLPDDGWRGRTGLVHQAVMADWPDLSSHEVYACGAPAMVDAAQRDFTTRCGLDGAQFYADAFLSQADRAAV